MNKPFSSMTTPGAPFIRFHPDAGGTAGAAAPSPSGDGQAHPNPSGQAHQFSIPAGHRLVSESDWSIAERNREAASGAKQTWDRIKKLGFEKLEDLEAFAPAIQTMRDRKIDPAMFSRSFAMDVDDEGEGKPPAFDAAKFEKDFESKWERKQAERDWRSQLDQEPKLYEAAAKQLQAEFPDVPPFLLQDAIRGRAEQLREMYEEGHSLRGQFLKPHGEGLAGKLSEYYKAEKTKHAGAGKAAKADAAIAAEKKGAVTAAGRSGGSGAPEKKKPNPYDPHDEDAINAAYEAKKAARAAGARG